MLTIKIMWDEYLRVWYIKNCNPGMKSRLNYITVIIQNNNKNNFFKIQFYFLTLKNNSFYLNVYHWLLQYKYTYHSYTVQIFNLDTSVIYKHKKFILVFQIKYGIFFDYCLQSYLYKTTMKQLLKFNFLDLHGPIYG